LLKLKLRLQKKKWWNLKPTWSFKGAIIRKNEKSQKNKIRMQVCKLNPKL
jgi:hypothetical protein